MAERDPRTVVKFGAVDVGPFETRGAPGGEVVHEPGPILVADARLLGRHVSVGDDRVRARAATDCDPRRLQTDVAFTLPSGGPEQVGETVRTITLSGRRRFLLHRVPPSHFFQSPVIAWLAEAYTVVVAPTTRSAAKLRPGE